MFSHWSRPQLGLATHAVQEVVHRKQNLSTRGCVILYTFRRKLVDNLLCLCGDGGGGDDGERTDRRRSVTTGCTRLLIIDTFLSKYQIFFAFLIFSSNFAILSKTTITHSDPMNL